MQALDKYLSLLSEAPLKWVCWLLQMFSVLNPTSDKIWIEGPIWWGDHNSDIQSKHSVCLSTCVTFYMPTEHKLNVAQSAKSWQIRDLPSYVTLSQVATRNWGKPQYCWKVAQERYSPVYFPLEIVCAQSQRINATLKQTAYWYTFGANLISQFTICFTIANCRK